MKHIHGGNIYKKACELDFSANINPLGMPAAVREAACRGVMLSEAYPDPDCTALREAIARREGVLSSQVICGNGAAELIFAVAEARSPKRALLTAPGFAEYEAALERAGTQITYYPLEEDSQYALREDFIDHMLAQPGPDMIFLCNPNNPTGGLIDENLLERIVKISAQRKILLVVDECFLELSEGGESRSVLRYLSGNPYLFVLKAFTKLFAMPGLRLGYGLCDDRALLDAMEHLGQPWRVSLPAQMAGVAAMAETDFARESRDYITRERQYLQGELAKLNSYEIKAYPAAANFVFFSGPEELGRQCAARGILVRDCGNYRGLGKGFWRIAVRRHEENVRLVEVLRAVLGKRNGYNIDL